MDVGKKNKKQNKIGTNTEPRTLILLYGFPPMRLALVSVFTLFLVLLTSYIQGWVSCESCVV